MHFSPPVISVDVEDWPQSTWDHDLPITARGANNTRKVLRVMAETGITSTMFVLGKFAETFPEVVKEIHAAGHEIGSHGYGHTGIFKQSPAQFRADVQRSKDHLEQLIGEPVRGYRAPDFSIVGKSLWALDVLVDLGFEFDSSIYPTKRRRYGIANWPLTPHRVILADGRSILECPMAAWPCFGRNWPVGGGGYHRLLPSCAIHALARRILAKGPYVYYCHPYEFDPLELREIDLEISWIFRKHQETGRRHFENRFRAFVAEFGGRPFRELIHERAWPDYVLAEQQPQFYGSSAPHSAVA